MKEQLETPQHGGKMARIRQHLKEHGTATAQQLAEVAGIESGRVSALMKEDLRSGRIEFIEGYDGEKRVYRIGRNHNTGTRLAKAIGMLEELGYMVIAP